jgi:hypothetical protein
MRGAGKRLWGWSAMRRGVRVAGSAPDRAHAGQGAQGGSGWG